MLDKKHAFKDEYFFLSNMYPCEVWYQDIKYPSSENAYQAAKFADPEVRKYFALLSPKESKKKAADKNCKFKKVDKWNDDIKVEVMREILYDKFTRNDDLRERLLATEDMELIEYNWWKDKFWGIYNDEGKNWLGELLMEVREYYLMKRDGILK